MALIYKSLYWLRPAKMGTPSCTPTSVPIHCHSCACRKCYLLEKQNDYRDRVLKERKFFVELSQKFQNCRSPRICCSINMAAGHPDSSEKFNFRLLTNKAKDIWDNMPQVVKRFPWDRAFGNFVQLTLDLFLAVVKFLCVPLLAVSSLSEMSYCAHQRKLMLVPFPFLLGVAIAWVFKETLLDLSPLLKEGRAEIPWHLIALAIVFTLVKLPGPSYPYWGRIVVPHMANGALLSSWFAYLLYRKSPKETPNDEVL